MIINPCKLEYQFAVISTAVQAIEELSDALEDVSSGERPALPFTIRVMAQKIREASVTAETELSELMEYDAADRSEAELLLIK